MGFDDPYDYKEAIARYADLFETLYGDFGDEAETDSLPPDFAVKNRGYKVTTADWDIVLRSVKEANKKRILRQNVPW